MLITLPLGSLGLVVVIKIWYDYQRVYHKLYDFLISVALLCCLLHRFQSGCKRHAP